MLQAEPKWDAVRGVPFAHVPNPSTQVKGRHPTPILLPAARALEHEANSISACKSTEAKRDRIKL